MTTQDRLNELLEFACEHFGANNLRQLAPHLGVDYSNVWRWRNEGVITPQTEALLRILNIMIPGPLPKPESVEA